MRDTLERFRGEIEAISDTLALAGLEDSLIGRARLDRDNPLLHLRLGFVAQRLGDLTGVKSHYDDAGSEFEWATDLEPEWPYGWYGLGLAELALGEHSIIPIENIRQILGLDYLSKAGRAFAEAARVDPAFANAVVDLAEVAMQQHIRARTDAALGAVRAAAATEAGAIPAVQLARGRLERMIGDRDSALSAFGRYVATGGDSGIGSLEAARTLFALGRAREAAREYYEGAALAGSAAAAALYREDVGWVATPDEIAAFDSAGSGGRAEWLRGFWRRRDLSDARAPGERLAEHYRRYFVALERYRLVTRHRRYDVANPFRSQQRVFDDRGIIYLRHGEPDRRATFAHVDVDPNESWLYLRADGNLIFHFVASSDIQDYKLVESLPDVLGLDIALRLQAGDQSLTADPDAPVPGLPETVEGLFESRVALAAVYQQLAAGQFTGRDRLLSAERRAGERSIAVGTTTDRFPLSFSSGLGSTVIPFVVSDETGRQAELLVQFAVPTARLARERHGDVAVYRLGVRVVAGDPAGDSRSVLDTVVVFRGDTARPVEQRLAGYVTVPIEPGPSAVKVVLTDPVNRAGDLLSRDSLSVPDFGADSLVLSDLVLGVVGGELTWVRGADTVQLNTAGGFPLARPLEVYYEIHGLAPASPYRARVEVRRIGGGSPFRWIARLFGGGGPPIALAFDGVAEGPVTRITHEVDIGALRPGRYRLVVTLRTPDGRETERATEFDAGVR
jgi:GWxTD domain-containing protein